MPPTGATRPRLAPPPPPPSGVLFFVHGANETSEGLARNVARIEDQVSRRGWDVRVVAPEWRRRSGLRLGNWRKALYRGARPAAISISNVPRGVGPRGCPEARDQLLRGPARDAARYGRRPDAGRRDRLPRAPRLDPGRAARGVRQDGEGGAWADGPARRAFSLGGIALVDLVASWPEAPVEACVTVGSQAPLLYTFDAIPSLPYDEADPPRLPVPWLNVYDSRDFLSFVAEPLFRRTDGLATVVDLRVHSGRDFPRSHSAYWELPAVWDGIATAFTWRRTDRMTVREARELGFEARKAPTPRS